jgi:GH18 family chitinase
LEYSPGQTHSILSVYFFDQAKDKAGQWQNFANKQQYVKDYHNSGIKVMVTVGGGTVTPTTSNWDAATAAKNVAQFVTNNYLDGVDLDWEVCCAKPRITSNPFLLV